MDFTDQDIGALRQRCGADTSIRRFWLGGKSGELSVFGGQECPPHMKKALRGAERLGLVNAAVLLRRAFYCDTFSTKLGAGVMDAPFEVAFTLMV